MTCEICSTTEGRFVRDHNHFTGMIRGILCEHCNSWLGTYELNIRKPWKQRGRSKYKAWVTTFGEFIKKYLAQDKGIPYKHGPDIQLLDRCLNA
jgi:hypothetical protein